MMKQPSEQDKQLFQQAMHELKEGDPAEAVRLFEQVRNSWQDDPDIWYLEGLAYGKLEKLDDLVRVSNKALETAPEHFGALCNLANTQMLQGDPDGALENYRKALQSKPDASEVLDNYGRALSMLGRREEAIEHYRKALHFRGNFAPAHASLAQAYEENGDPGAAMQEYTIALELDPRDYNAHCGIAGLYTGEGGMPYAEYHYKEAVRIDKRNPRAYFGLASVERYKGNYDKVLDILDTAGEFARRGDPQLDAFTADCLERMGNIEEAYEILAELANNEQMNAVAVAAYARLCHQFETCDEALHLIELSAQKPATNSMEKQGLMYAAGKILDKLGRYDEAMNYFRLANEMIAAPLEKDYREMYNHLIQNFSKDAMQKLPRATTGSTRPIFILGMPRSGTTLTEHILASHPDVFGAGELADIKELVRSIRTDNTVESDEYTTDIANVSQAMMTDMANKYLDSLNALNSEAKYVTDKLPHNFQHVGFISLLFPEARIIHCRRNPLDNCLSIYFQSFIWSHDYAVDLTRIGNFYSEYDRLMRHWEDVVDIPILTVQYEDMIEDQEGMTRKLLDFCGLEWNESVMEFHDLDRTVATASYDQVRQPLYKTSKARWKNYAKYLGPLKDALPAHCLSGIEQVEKIPPS